MKSLGPTSDPKDIAVQSQIPAGLTNFTYSLAVSAPNATVPVVATQATGSATNIDYAVVPKGTGAFMLQIPDSTTAGGNKRGTNAVDLQMTRSSAAQVASGARAFAAGSNNIASGIGAVAIGDSNTSSSTNSFSGGSGCTASSVSATAMGTSNTADGQYSTVLGGRFGSARGVVGARAWGSYGISLGTTQTEEFILRADTTNATATRLTTTGAGAVSSNGPMMPNTSSYYCRIRVMARNTTNGDSASWTATALIHREANAASTVVIGTPSVTQDFASASLTACVVAITADTTLGALAVTVTGIASTSLRWVAHVETLESTN